ncbi:MAG: 4Fe-4S binding protein [Clostridia bacterium]|nr:4Fe-4S binding protein [Clostridia bacterium]
MRTVAYRFRSNGSACIQCGVCMDVCPVRALDMTRPRFAGPEGRDGSRQEVAPGEAPYPWMTVFPIQVGECTGCMICAQECPVNIITIERVDGPVALAPSQGPQAAEPEEDGAWHPLSSYTRATARRTTLSNPWGSRPRWPTRSTLLPKGGRGR